MSVPGGYYDLYLSAMASISKLEGRVQECESLLARADAVTEALAEFPHLNPGEHLAFREMNATRIVELKGRIQQEQQLAALYLERAEEEKKGTTSVISQM